MMDLRKYAKNQSCQIRVPGVCRFQPEYTVWCHVRMVGLSGASLKALDILGAFGCDACHLVVDGQQKSEYSYGERRLMLLEGMARSQTILAREGILVVQDPP